MKTNDTIKLTEKIAGYSIYLKDNMGAFPYVNVLPTKAISLFLSEHAEYKESDIKRIDPIYDCRI